MNYLKNPIVIGITVCVLVMIVMYCRRPKEDMTKDTKKKMPFNFITPMAVGLVAWFIAETLINKKNITPEIINQPVTQNTTITNPINNPITNPINNPIISGPIMPNKVGGNNGGYSETIGTDATNTFNIISKDNIKLPPLDVFIDLANFP